jgi:hypothetical protein
LPDHAHAGSGSAPAKIIMVPAQPAPDFGRWAGRAGAGSCAEEIPGKGDVVSSTWTIVRRGGREDDAGSEGE